MLVIIIIINYYILDYIYWSDDEQGTIMRIKRDGTCRQIIVNHEHSGEITLGTWVAGIIKLNYIKIFYFILLKMHFFFVRNCY